MDLPRELRNAIYEYWLPSPLYRMWFYFYLNPGRYMKRPIFSVLRVPNKRFLDEIGSFYLYEAVAVVQSCERSSLGFLLEALGDSNVTKMLTNDTVWWEFAYHGGIYELEHKYV